MSSEIPLHRRSVAPTRRRGRRGAAALLALLPAAILLVGCGDDPEPNVAGGPAVCTPEDLPEPITRADVDDADTDGTTVRLVTHDSFYVDEATFEPFTEATGIEVELLPAGDAGSMVSSAVLTAGNPVGDVMYGIDTTFLCRGTAAGLFIPYEAAGLDDIPAELRQAEQHLATPVDVGDVCLNFSRGAFPDGEGAPTSLADLTEPELAGAFVTQNPETSSPGMAFLLATIAEFGEDGWEDYWRDLRDNDIEITSGWSEAYEDSFGAGDGERSIVTSYASSPVADVLYSDPPRDEANIGVVADSCFRQVEFAGVLRGTDRPEAAAKLVDFLISPEFQAEVPLAMFVAPANSTVELPEEYAAHATVVDDPIALDPAVIEAGRDRWTSRWTEIALR